MFFKIGELIGSLLALAIKTIIVLETLRIMGVKI